MHALLRSTHRLIISTKPFHKQQWYTKRAAPLAQVCLRLEHIALIVGAELEMMLPDSTQNPVYGQRAMYEGVSWGIKQAVYKDLGARLGLWSYNGRNKLSKFDIHSGLVRAEDVS